MKTFVAILALCASAAAQELVVQDGEIRTAAHEVKAEVHHRVAATTVTQVFENLSERQREGTYFFTVAPGGTIVDFRMWVGDREMHGQMLERSKAEEVYQRYVNRRVDPGILDHVRDNVWRVRVFPILPHGAIKFQTRYLEVLAYEAGSIAYTYPVTVSHEKAQKMDHFSIDVQVEAGTPVRKVDSGKLSTQFKSKTCFAASADRSNVEFQKDLTVRYEVSDGELDLRLMAHRPRAEDGHFLLAVTPNLLKQGEKPLPKEVVYLLDVSRSIDEALLKTLARSVHACLRELAPEDRFNLVAFNAQAKAFQKASVAPTAENLRAAAKFLETLKPSGRTDLEEALGALLAEKAEATRLVFVVSDGEPTAGSLSGRDIVNDALSKVDANTLFFGVRIGQPGVDRTLETLAERSGGECFAAPDADALERTLFSALRRCSRPIMTDVRLDLGGAGAYAVFPARHTRLFVDEQLLVSGRYATPGTHEVILRGRLAGREVEVKRSLEFPEKQERWGSAAFVWAGRQLSSLLGDAFLKAETEDLKKTAIALSKEYRIMSPYTAFLVLEQDEMYAASGLERTADDPRILFMRRKDPRKRARDGENAAGIPEPTKLVKPVDLYAASGDQTPLSSLRWLAVQQDPPKALGEGTRALGETGVQALTLLAYAESYGFQFAEDEFRRIDPAADRIVLALRQAQGKDGAIGRDLFEHVLAAEALSRLLQMRTSDPRVRDTLQKAVSFLSDKPGALDRKGVPALALPLLVRARDLGLEVDPKTIKLAESTLDPASEALYVRARMALDSLADRDPKVLMAVRRVAERGPADPLQAFLGTEALLAWRGTGSVEWKQWKKGLERYRSGRATDGSYLPAKWQDDSRRATTALRVLILSSSGK